MRIFFFLADEEIINGLGYCGEPCGLSLLLLLLLFPIVVFVLQLLSWCATEDEWVARKWYQVTLETISMMTILKMTILMTEAYWMGRLVVFLTRARCLNAFSMWRIHKLSVTCDCERVWRKVGMMCLQCRVRQSSPLFMHRILAVHIEQL